MKFEELEYKDVLTIVQKLYPELSTELMHKMTDYLMELDKKQNDVYELANKICLMVEDPSVYRKIMREFHE